jgi:hypothetical protein
VPCWIEGGWRSYFSHWNGPPTKGKPFDRWRRITIVMGQPEVLPAEMLADQRKTRHHLTEAVFALRQHLPEQTGSAATAPPAPDDI